MAHLDLDRGAPASHRPRVTSRNRRRTRAPAPGDYRIFEQDMAGAYFIARPLMEKYDALRKPRRQPPGRDRRHRIDAAKARAEVAALQVELIDLLKTIDQAKLYIPGATVHKRTETTHVPIQPDDLLLVDCENVDVRGWDGPDVQCVLEKTVLDEERRRRHRHRRRLRRDRDRLPQGLGQGVLRVLSGRPGSAEDSRTTRICRTNCAGSCSRTSSIANSPTSPSRGWSHQEGNRQIDVTVRSERGDGFSAQPVAAARHAHAARAEVPAGRHPGRARAAQGPRPERRAFRARPGATATTPPCTR